MFTNTYESSDSFLSMKIPFYYSFEVNFFLKFDKILFKLELSPTKYDFIGDSSNLKSSPYNLLPLIVDGD